jgi:hypothetical protein
MKSVNCIPLASSAAALCGSVRPAGKLGAAHEKRRGCFSALIACVLINGAAIAQGPPAATRQSVAPEPPATRQSPVAPQLSRAVQPPIALQPPATAPPPTAGQPPTPGQLPALDACLGRLDPELDIGYDRIAARCPELAKQLDHGAWAPWLPRGWKEAGNDLSAGGLKEFRELVDRESAASASPRAPDIRHLKGVLNGLEGTGTAGWWSRFKEWLRSRLETREQPTDESWFARMVSHVGISQSLRKLIAYAALTGVIVLAAVIVINEVRAAGLLPKRGAVARRRRGPRDTRAPHLAWSDIEPAPLSDKPRLLLELIVRRLSERGYLPPAGALTVRELAKAARLPESDDRARLAELALAAERVRYSAREIESAALDESVARGRELLDRLDASTPR